MAQIPQRGNVPTEEAGSPVQVTDTGGGSMPSMPAPDVGGSVGSVPSGVDVRNENAPQIDQLRSQIDSLRQRLQRLQDRPTQDALQSARQEADQIRERAQQAVQVAYRLGIARAIRSLRNS